MKTQFLLDRQELAELWAGKPFNLEVGNGVVIVLQAEHPTAGRSRVKTEPVATKTEESRGRKRRSFTKERRSEIFQYAKGHGVARAAARYKVRPALIYAWRRGGQ